MRIALLIGAEPKKVKNGPFVRLGPGEWKIAFANVKDTTFQLSDLQSSSILPAIQDMCVTGPAHVKIHVSNPGSEKFISVYADSQ